MEQWGGGILSPGGRVAGVWARIGVFVGFHKLKHI